MTAPKNFLLIIAAPVFFILLLKPVQGFTAVIYTSSDTTIQPKKPYKIKEQEFLDYYGKDDSARALINYYFIKRRLVVKNIAEAGGTIFIPGFFLGIIALT